MIELSKGSPHFSEDLGLLTVTAVCTLLVLAITRALWWCIEKERDPQMQRKALFLSSTMRTYYGYSEDIRNPRFIDHWREREFPHLIRPLLPTVFRCSLHHHIQSAFYNLFHKKSPHAITNNKEVYLDFAGSSLPTQTQLHQIHAFLIQPHLQVLGNPHSSGPAAARTAGEIHVIYKRILDFFGANGGSSLASSDSSSSNSDDNHPGYHILFTSGATEALRIVAEHFPWQRLPCDDPNHTSTLLYPHNSHTSVIGMRACALQNGASFQCVHVSNLIQAVQDSYNHHQSCNNGCGCFHNLVVLPLECNFSGSRFNTLATNLIQTIKKKQSNHPTTPRKWYSLVDISKAAATSPINLCSLDPDFACVSFYKLFGFPTGLGVLFVKRTSTHILTGKTFIENTHPSSSSSSSLSPHPKRRNHYFGGGSVDAVASGFDFVIPRSKEDQLSSLIHGTPNFQSIILLRHGFDAISRLGGMEKIRNHTHCLQVELVSRLHNLRHPNGRPAIIVYGHSRDDDSAKDMDAGPTVSFNMIRSDGAYVGYHEVEKLAALSTPPLQFRTGCFCNPGSCHHFFGYTDQDILNLAYEENTICGDHNDIINGKPTGAIRVSFGPYSLWEDLDALVIFAEKYCINKGPQTKGVESIRTAPLAVTSDVFSVKLTEIYIFPIKSCAGEIVRRNKSFSFWTQLLTSAPISILRYLCSYESKCLENRQRDGYAPI